MRILVELRKQAFLVVARRAIRGLHNRPPRTVAVNKDGVAVDNACRPVALDLAIR